jgi:hypothetical protein
VETKLGLFRAAAIVVVAGYVIGFASYLVEGGIRLSSGSFYLGSGVWIFVLWYAATLLATGAAVAALVRQSGFRIGVVESTVFVLLGRLVAFGLVVEGWRHAPDGDTFRDVLLVLPYGGALGLVATVLGILIPAWLINSAALPPGMKDLPEIDPWPADFVPPDAPPTHRRY